METLTAQEAYNQIVEHIKKQRGPAPGWYAGITADWEARLFEDHQVPRQDQWYIARQCQSNASARSVEDALLRYGCDGGSGGGDEDAVFVYAYLKGTMTKP